MSFQFVEDRKIDGATRKLIRSHVMRGKNLGKTRIRPSKQLLENSNKEIIKAARPIVSKYPETSEVIDIGIPPSVGNEFSFFTFPCEMRPYMRHMILQFMSMASQYVYPTEFCLPVDHGKAVWFQYLASDEAFFYSVLAMSEVRLDSISGLQESPNALRHLSMTYRCIRRQLQKCGIPSDPILAAVMSMSIHEDLRGYPSRSKVHIDALQQMINLRGGLQHFDTNSILLQKMCRADIEYALQFCSRPRFSRDQFPRELIRSSLLAQSISEEELRCIVDDLKIHSPDLRLSFLDLLSVSRLLNSGHTPFRLDPYAYQEVLISVLYRLLDVPQLTAGGNNDELETVCRVGLIATVCTLFFQYARSERLSYDLLAGKLRKAIEMFSKNGTNTGPFLLWLLFIGGLSVFGTTDEAWLHGQVRNCSLAINIHDWKSARDKMKLFPWIEKAHDKPGKDLWQAIFLN